MILYYLLILSLPLISHPVFGRTIGGITVVKYLGGLCIVYAVFSLARGRRLPSFLATMQARAFVLFFALAIASYFTIGARGSGGSMGESMAVIYTSHLLFFVTTIVIVNSMSRLRWTLLAVTGSLGWASLYVLRDWQLGSAAHGLDYRPGYVTGDPNFFTASAILSIPVGFTLFREARTRWEKLFCLGCLVAAVFAIMLAASRSGFLGLVAACLVSVWYSRRRVRNFVLIGAVLVIAATVSPHSPLTRLLAPRQSDVEAADTRLALWDAGLEIIRAHPLTGIGLGNFRSTVNQFAGTDVQLRNMAHNTYLEMGAELGLPGLVVYLGIWVFTFRSLHRTRRQAQRSGQSLVLQAAEGIQAGLFGFAVTSFFLSVQFLKLFWFMVFLSMCLPPLVAGAIAKQARAKKQEAEKNAGVSVTESVPPQRSPEWARL